MNMGDARNLVEKIKTDLKALDEKILRHPYISALSEGRVPKDALKVFAGQQYHIITSDLRSVANLVSRHGELSSRQWLLGVLQGEAAALDALFGFAEKLRMSEGDLKAFEPLPAGHAYCAYVAWLGMYGSDAELAGAFLVNFAAWGANCGEMAKSLQARYGFSKEDVAFFDLFANVPPFEKEALAVIQASLDRGVEPYLVHRAARMLQAYELMFWDTMAEVAGVA
jgi:thiaminase